MIYLLIFLSINFLKNSFILYKFESRVNTEQWSHKDVFSPIPRTCEYVALHSKMDFADVIKFKDLEIGKLFQITG
jgi:hypothetical protein